MGIVPKSSSNHEIKDCSPPNKKCTKREELNPKRKGEGEDEMLSTYK